MITEANRSMGGKWRERQQKKAFEKAIEDAKQNDPAALESRKASQARQEAERAEQARNKAEAEARRAAEMVSFGPLTIKMATEIVLAFERYRSAGREATPAEIDAVLMMSRGQPVPPAYPQVRVTYGLSLPLPVSGVPSVPARAVETVTPQTAPVAIDNVPRKPTKGKAQPDVLLDGQFLIED